MHYIKLISEEHFTAGRSLVILLPLTEEGTNNKEVGYLIEELHASGRWPILVFNVVYEMERNMYTEIHQYGIYIILLSGLCKEWKKLISGFWQQIYELSVDKETWLLYNPRGKYIVSAMSNCNHLDTIHISRAILDQLWFFKVTNAAVLLLNSNEHRGNNLQQNTTDSAQGTCLELRTWYPCENSDM
jgi:hypothetical protein